MSTRSDIQDAFDKYLGFHGSLRPEPNTFSAPPPGYDLIRHTWPNEDLPFGSVSILMMLGQDSGQLEQIAIGINESYTDVYSDMYPQRIIRELGAPKQWLASKRYGGQGEGYHLGVTSMMIYDNGISFTHIGELPTPLKRNTSGAVIAEPANFCLGIGWGAYFNGIADIGEPLKDGFDNLSPIQDLQYSLRKGLKPIQDVLPIGLDEIVKRAQEEQDPCWTIDTPVP